MEEPDLWESIAEEEPLGLPEEGVVQVPEEGAELAGLAENEAPWETVESKRKAKKEVKGDGKLRPGAAETGRSSWADEAEAELGSVPSKPRDRDGWVMAAMRAGQSIPPHIPAYPSVPYRARNRFTAGFAFGVGAYPGVSRVPNRSDDEPEKVPVVIDRKFRKQHADKLAGVLGAEWNALHLRSLRNQAWVQWADDRINQTEKVARDMEAELEALKKENAQLKRQKEEMRQTVTKVLVDEHARVIAEFEKGDKMPENWSDVNRAAHQSAHDSQKGRQLSGICDVLDRAARGADEQQQADRHIGYHTRMVESRRDLAPVLWREKGDKLKLNPESQYARGRNLVRFLRERGELTNPQSWWWGAEQQLFNAHPAYLFPVTNPVPGTIGVASWTNGSTSSSTSLEFQLSGYKTLHRNGNPSNMTFRKIHSGEQVFSFDVICYRH
ncbi:hypothetical protein BDV95DRAFT_615565 [Massariosphaeria phaeospora]|uniref:Uncharacterized protein n=1 Tax=Massariosphaeria phaeospora TaxID=100035 RepID=A0A7C8IG50_9PLEO|nr:hypothetical protein BDV95DRAFT_615565 [Massariosphaeria phaeospora]